MTKQQRKEIEQEFYNYEKNRLLAAEYISTRALAGIGVDYSKERVKGTNENTVENSVVKTIDEAERLWKWCKVFENTLDRFRWTQKDKLMRMRYLDRNHEECICGVIGIERRTYFYWVEDVLQVAYLWAEELKLF